MSKKAIKSLLGQGTFALNGHVPLLGDQGIIVLFHRVDDRLKDNPISCGVQEFREYCKFFGDHFEVIGVPEMLGLVAAGESMRGKLAISFDDGYLDNSEDAAPILLEHKLPATFYIATDFIGSQHVPWWDEDLPFKPEWMSWDQVRWLRDQGFTIGGHTQTHVDLGKVDLETAEREIRVCKARLEAELGQSIEHFSFPYGRAENIREATRQLVAAAGFTSCVSAHGGLVRPGDHSLNVAREPISPWFESPFQFGFELIVAHQRVVGSN